MNEQTENALEGHTCSYYCDRPGCIKVQRDELRDQMEKRIDYAVKSAVEGEREACAKVCEALAEAVRDWADTSSYENAALFIRARGEVK